MNDVIKMQGINNVKTLVMCFVGFNRDGSVGIATRYGLDSPGIESRWGGEIFRTRPDRPWGPPSLYLFFPGGKPTGVWC